jgi:cell division protein FtsW (lipid II flippase)
MLQNNKHVQDFLEAVCRELRYKSIHEDILRELSNHIEDQRGEFIKAGFDEEIAVSKAVDQMGDPVQVGKQLNKAHLPRTEWSILSVMAILVLMGGAVQHYLSGVGANSVHMFTHFLLYAPVGIAAFALAYFFDYTLLERNSKRAYLLLFVFTIVAYFISSQKGGAFRHVYYFVLLFIPVFAGIITSMRNRGYWGIVVAGFFYAGFAAMCIMAPSFSGLLLLTFCCLTILTVAIEKGYFGGKNIVSFALVYIPVVMGLFFVLIASPVMRNRLYSMINPETDPQGYGWLALQIRHIISSSQFLGEAVLEGIYSQGSLAQLFPGWATDYSLTYLIASLGFAAGLIITAFMLTLIIRMFLAVLKQKHAYGFLVSFSACLAITGQMVFYILANLGVFVTYDGILPFVSFGPIGFIVNMALVGLVLSVYRLTDVASKNFPDAIGERRFVALIEDQLIIDLGCLVNKKGKEGM